MGYSTRYEMSWTATADFKTKPLCPHNPPKSAKFCAECGRPVGVEGLDDLVGDYIEEHDEMSYALSRDGKTNDSCKWYEHLEQLGEMSKQFPGVLFHLQGEGEDSGDIWDAFAFHGQTQKHEAKIVRVESPDPKGWK